MFDHLFSALLAFIVLAAGTLAIGTAWFEQPVHAAQLPKVHVVGKRLAAAQTVAQCDSTGAVQVR
jgi:hypothetical protein